MTGQSRDSGKEAADEIERLQRELSETEALRAEGTAKIADLTLALSTARRTVDDLRAALTNAAAFIENTIEDGSETEKYDRAFVAELVAALKGDE